MSVSATITVTAGPNRGKVFELAGEMARLGTAPDNEVVLSDPQLGNYHASIVHRQGRFAIFTSVPDGVAVDDTILPVERWVWLPEKTTIRLGSRTTADFVVNQAEKPSSAIKAAEPVGGQVAAAGAASDGAARPPKQQAGTTRPKRNRKKPQPRGVVAADSRVLLASQKKQVLESCRAVGLDPRDFEWEELQVGNSTQVVSKIIHKPTGYYFLFDFQQNGMHVTEYSPGEDKQRHNCTQNYWNDRWLEVEKWTKYLAREVEADDFIRTVMAEPPLEAALISQSDVPFTEDQQKLLLARLDEVEQHVVEIKSMSAEESAGMRHEFDVLRTEIKRTGRTAWIRMLVGSVFWICKLFFGHDEAIAVWHFVNEKFATVLRLIAN